MMTALLRFPQKTTLGRYRIDALIGKGGMGEVYKAFDPGLNRIVALKTIRPEMSDAQSLERFYREARAGGHLEHSRIVRVYDISEADGTVFIAMEFLEGKSLAALLEEGALTVERKTGILVQILEGLAYAHGKGIIHRDIKPGNVQVLPDYSIKILDFGLARFTTTESAARSTVAAGTLHYISPEQLEGRAVDHRTDIYSLGALAYELFAGRRPYQGDSVAELVLKIMTQPPPPMDTAFASTFPELEQIITKAMAKSPSDRYAAAREMADALEAFRQAHAAAIAQFERRLAESSQETLVLVKTVLAQGRDEESVTLLNELLARDPDFREARALLGRTAARLGDAGTAAEQSGGPAPAPALPGQVAEKGGGAERIREDAARTPAVGAAVAFAPSAAQPAGTATPNGVQAPSVGPSWRRKAALPVFILLLAIIGFTVARRALTDKPGPAAPGEPSASVDERASTGAPRSGGPETPRGEARSQLETPDENVPGRSRRQAAPARPSSSTERSQGSGGAAAPIQGSLFIEGYPRAAVNDELAALVAEGLRARGIPLSPARAAADRIVRVRADVVVQPSPFSETSALTAHYVGVLEIGRRGDAAPRRSQFEGHVMEFGANVVRAAALRELASKIVDATAGFEP